SLHPAPFRGWGWVRPIWLYRPAVLNLEILRPLAVAFRLARSASRRDALPIRSALRKSPAGGRRDLQQAEHVVVLPGRAHWRASAVSVPARLDILGRSPWPLLRRRAG